METTKPTPPMNMAQQTQTPFQTIPLAQLDQAGLTKYIEQGMVPCQIVQTGVLLPNGTVQLQSMLVPIYNLLPQNFFKTIRQTSQHQPNPSTTPPNMLSRPTLNPTPSFISGVPSVSQCFAPIPTPQQNLPNTVSKAPSVKKNEIEHNLNAIPKNTNRFLHPTQIRMSHPPNFTSPNKQNNLNNNTNTPNEKIKSNLANNAPVQSNTPEEVNIAKESLEEKTIPEDDSNCEKLEKGEEVEDQKIEEEFATIGENMNEIEEIINHDVYEDEKENIEIDTEFVADEALETTNFNLKQTNNHNVIEDNSEIIFMDENEERKEEEKKIIVRKTTIELENEKKEEEEIIFEIKTLTIEEKQTEEVIEKNLDVNLNTNKAKALPNLKNENNLGKKKNEVSILNLSNSNTDLDQSNESQTNITTDCHNKNNFDDEEEFPSLIGAPSRGAPVNVITKIVMESRSTSNSTTPRNNDSHSVAGSVSSSGDSLSVCSDTRSRGPSQREKVMAFLYQTQVKCRVRASRSITGEVVGILQKGVEVKITEVVGNKGRIVSPLDGYVSMRKKGKNQLKKVFEGVPTVCLRNLPTDYLSRAEDIKDFLRKKGARPSHVIWRIHRNSGDFCTHAFVEFDRHRDAQKLMNMKDLRMHGEKLKVDWSRRYGNEIEI